MKWESNTKIARNQEIIRRHIEHPELALKEIGEEFGITKQRVGQIILRDRRRNGK